MYWEDVRRKTSDVRTDNRKKIEHRWRRKLHILLL